MFLDNYSFDSILSTLVEAIDSSNFDMELELKNIYYHKFKEIPNESLIEWWRNRNERCRCDINKCRNDIKGNT